MGISERKEKQKLELKKQILDASLQLFLEEGYEKVTIRKIADIIEYSPTTIYLYFKDKNEILFALHELGFQKLNEYNSNLAHIGHPLVRLHKMGENYLRFALENPGFYDIMFLQNAPMQAICDEDWELGDNAYKALEMIVQECMDKKIIHQTDVHVAVTTIWSAVHGMASLVIKQRIQKMKPDVDFSALLQGCLGWFLTILEAK